VTRTTKVLADGTKITKESKSKIYRDSEGRTRREIGLGMLGPLEAEGEAVTTVTINDPVAKRVYVMRKGSKTARKIELLQPEHSVTVEESQESVSESTQGEKHKVKIVRMTGKDMEKGALASGENVWVETGVIAGEPHVVGEHDFTVAAPHMMVRTFEDAKEEALGEKVIEGVVAQGTRRTTTIPEGKIGNDRPITIVTERWYSPELDAVVLTDTKDPMSGDVTYQLTNVNRAEPDPALFEIPTDVRVEDGTKLRRHIRVEQRTEREEK
jgi:hypothetical protein